MTLADCESRQGGDEAELVAAVARRDAAAFRVLVERHAGVVHALAYRMLGDRHEAEDVVQEALLRLWDGAVLWQPRGGGVPGWLRRVATNLCIDRVRKTGRLSDSPAPEQTDPTPAADTLIDTSRSADRARAALQVLPDRQRAAIVLTYYEEISNAAAADILGLKIKAFESLLVRARAALRERLAGIAAIEGDVV